MNARACIQGKQLKRDSRESYLPVQAISKCPLKSPWSGGADDASELVRVAGTSRCRPTPQLTEASVTALPPTGGLLVYVTGWTAGRTQGLRGIVSVSVQSAAPDSGGW